MILLLNKTVIYLYYFKTLFIQGITFSTIISDFLVYIQVMDSSIKQTFFTQNSAIYLRKMCQQFNYQMKLKEKLSRKIRMKKIRKINNYKIYKFY